MAKVSVIGICGNSIFMNVDHFHENGETLSAESVYEEIGGKGINQAIAAARMGAEVSFLSAIGEDSDGAKCRQCAKENNIAGSFKMKDKKTTFACILTDKCGENCVTVYRAAELDEEDVLSFEREIAESEVLLLQHEVPEEVNETAVKLAKKHNVKVILNPAPIRKIPESIAENVFAVTPNEQERRAIDLIRFKNCITTLGNRGCSINDEVLIESLKVQAVDTTGAGDTFNGVLAVCIADGMDLKTACKYAVTASGLSVTRKYVLDSIPTRKEIEEKMKNE
ncbi:MAG: ribokinase [Oscillospiraceae bacterium]|nr:ribokinase [Oscillospiraceae bacterium]